MSALIQVTVTFRAGSYVTNQIGGQRASSTADAATAVERLGQKLLGTTFYSATCIEGNGGTTSVWEIRSAPVAPKIEARFQRADHLVQRAARLIDDAIASADPYKASKALRDADPLLERAKALLQDQP